MQITQATGSIQDGRQHIKLNLLIEPDNARVEGFYRRQGYANDTLLFMEKWLD